MLPVEWHSTDSSFGPWECFPESYLTPQSVGLHKAGPQGAPALFLEVELGKVMTGRPTVPFGLCNFNLHEAYRTRYRFQPSISQSKPMNKAIVC